MADLTYRVDINTKQAMTSLKNLQKQVKKTDNNFLKLGKSLASASFKVATTGLKSLTVAATAATAAFVAFGARALSALDNLEKASSKLGVSTEFLSSYQKVANEAGIATDTFTIGLQRFLRRLGEAQSGTGTLVKPLKELGINIKDANGNFREGTAVFDEYLRKLADTDEKTRQLALAMAAFDTEGVEFVNIASMGADAIDQIRQRAEEAGIVISRDLAENAARARDRVSDLIDVAKGFGLQFFGSLAPSLEQFAKDLRRKIIEAVEGAGGMEVFAKETAATFLRAMADFVDTMGNIIDGIVRAFQKGANILNRVVVAISNIPGAGFDAVIGDAPDRSAKIAELRAQIDEIDAKFEEYAQSVAENGGVVDHMMSGMMEGLLLKKQALSEQIKDLQNDNTIYLTQFEEGYNGASEAVANTTDKIREQADELDKAAKIARDFNEFDYPDRIQRLANAGANATSDDTTTTDFSQDASDIKHYNDAILRIAEANKRAEEANKRFANSFKSVRDRLLPLVAAQEKYEEELRMINIAYRKGMLDAKQYAEATKALKEEFQKFQESMEEGPKTWIDGWKAAMDEYVEKARDSASQASELFNTATRGMEDAIVEFARTGKLSFRSLLQDIAEQLLRSQIRQLMANVFGGFGGGGRGGSFLGNLFGGFFATGGYIPAGRVGVVGERGPEMVAGPASVTPMGGAANITYNINAVDVDSFKNLVASDPSFIYAVTEEGRAEFRNA